MPLRSVSLGLQILVHLIHVIDMLIICNALNHQYFGLKDDQVPVIVIQTNNGQKYIKPNLEPYDIASWVKEYKVILATLSN